MIFETTTEQLRSAWDRAICRARARGIAATKIAAYQRGYDGSVRYVTTSHSHPGEGHSVQVYYSARGVETYCDCEGAQHGRVCQHQAAALLAEGWLPLPAPVQPVSEPVVVAAGFTLSREERAYRVQSSAIYA